MKQLKNKKIIAIDYGTKRVGLAIADSTLSFALPLTVLDNNNSLLSKIKAIVVEEEINFIVLGFPKMFNDYISERHQLIIDFKNDLYNYLDKQVEIILFDESYSTKASFGMMQEFDLKKQHMKKNKDMVSAAVFLENYLNKIKGEKNGN